MDTLFFSLDGQQIPYRVRVSSRSRRIGLRFTDGRLEVVRPARLRGAFFPESVLHRFSGWIRRQLARHATTAEATRDMDGRILWRGRALRLERRSTDWLGGLGLVRADADAMVVETDGDGVAAAALLRTWIHGEARRALAEAMDRRSREMNQPFGRIAVRDQRWLWGSCSPRTGTVSLNVRLAMAPPDVLDYIVVHELAHFRWRGHGPRFWDRVERFCPDARRHRRWLRENGWRLRFPETVRPATEPVEAGWTTGGAVPMISA